jgi:hypothetical protein
VFPLSGIVHQSREFTASGTARRSKDVPFSAIPDPSNNSESPKVIGLSKAVHKSREFAQSTLFGSRHAFRMPSVREIPERVERKLKGLLGDDVTGYSITI